MSKPRNPPLFFPMWSVEAGKTPVIVPEETVTLRDLFAAAALAGVAASPQMAALMSVASEQGVPAKDALAQLAYQQADAMLREREKEVSCAK